MDQNITHVYLVYFFSHYLHMCYPEYKVEYVVMDEAKANTLVKVENERLRMRADYHSDQDAWFERVLIT